MTKFLLMLSAVGAGLSGVAAQADYAQPCPYPYDVCGWTLSSGTYGYTQAALEQATNDAGVDATTGTFVYDSVYNCFSDGSIGWSTYCGSGDCVAAPNQWDAKEAQCSGGGGGSYPGGGDAGDNGDDGDNGDNGDDGDNGDGGDGGDGSDGGDGGDDTQVTEGDGSSTFVIGKRASA